MASICGGSFPAAKAEALVVPRRPLASDSSSSSYSPSSSRNWVRLRRRECVVRCEVGFGGSRSSGAAGDQRLDFAPVSALEKLKIDATDRYMKERSSIMVIGLSVDTAPVEMREKLAIPEAEWPQAIRELCSLNQIEEATVLSTCNRTEIYVVALSQYRGVKEVTEWMSKVLPLSIPTKVEFFSCDFILSRINRMIGSYSYDRFHRHA